MKNDRPRRGKPSGPKARFGGPHSGKPGAEGSTFGSPGGGRPRSGKPDSGNPGSASPGYGGPKFEKPQFDKPKFEKPKFGKPRFGKPRFGKPRFGAGMGDQPAGPATDGAPQMGAEGESEGDPSDFQPTRQGRPGKGPHRFGGGRPGFGGGKSGFGGGRPEGSDRPARAGRPTLDRAKFLAPGLTIVHEDDDLIVVEKPPGMLTSVTTRSGPSTPRNVFDLVKVHVRRKRRGARAWIIHRLDKEASGLLVFAKNERAFATLKEQFRTKDVHRIYFAVGEGQVDPAKANGTIQSHLRQNHRGLMESVPVGEVTKLTREADPDDGSDDEGPMQQPRLAVTHYRVVGSGKGRTLFQLRLETGRKNQIRVHLRDLGHPICGDQRYRALLPDGTAPAPMDRDQIDHDLRVCLHAAELGFEHPTTKATTRYRSAVPAMFYKLIGQKPPPGSEPESQEPSEVPGAAERTMVPAPRPAAEGVAREPLAKDAGIEPRGKAVDSESSWEHVAGWYTGLVEDRGSDHHERVVIPGTLELLGDCAGKRVLDVACGTGVLSRALAERGARVLGVDSAPGLIQAARNAGIPGGGGFIEYHVHDARELGSIESAAFEDGVFDAAACVLALMNIEPLDPVLESCAARLAPGAPMVSVILHPAFRNPGRTAWGWDESGERAGPKPVAAKGKAYGKPFAKGKTASDSRSDVHQYRRVDAYLSESKAPIVMNPGAVSSGAAAVKTWTYHRPIGWYVAAFARAGLVVDALEEWASRRTSQPGPRAAEENRIRAEIPMFLAIRARKA